MHQSYNILPSNFHKVAKKKKFGGVKQGRKLVHVCNSVLLYISTNFLNNEIFSNHLLKVKGTFFYLTRFLKVSW